MSLLRRIVGTVAPVLGSLGGPVGTIIGSAVGAAVLGSSGGGATSLPGIGTASVLPAIGPIAGAAGRVAIAGAGAAMRGAVAWCRRNPAWCATVGGTAAVSAMIENGQLPMPRRRRGRGLSSSDLRGFRKTVRLIRATAGSVGLRGRARGRSAGASSTLIAQN